LDDESLEVVVPGEQVFELRADGVREGAVGEKASVDGFDL
jgi:hypothetical protein